LIHFYKRDIYLATIHIQIPVTMKLPVSSRKILNVFGKKSATQAIVSTPVSRHYSQLNVTKDNIFVEYGKLIIANSINAKLKKQKTSGTSEAIYNPKVLEMYDNIVWKFNSPALWRIRKDDAYQLYKDCIGEKHCEIGVGTGLFLKDYVLDQDTPKQLSLALCDLNNNTLDMAEQRIKESAEASGKIIDLKTAIVDITNPGSIPTEMQHSYDSVAANFLLLCLHGGGLHDKVAGVQGCAALVKHDGWFFGSTLLGRDLLDDADNAGPAAIRTMEFYNEIGIFGNKGDSMEDLESVLKEVFAEVEVWRVGYCGAWSLY